MWGEWDYDEECDDVLENLEYFMHRQTHKTGLESAITTFLEAIAQEDEFDALKALLEKLQKTLA